MGTPEEGLKCSTGRQVVGGDPGALTAGDGSFISHPERSYIEHCQT